MLIAGESIVPKVRSAAALVGHQLLAFQLDRLIAPHEVHFDGFSSHEDELAVIDVRTGQMRCSCPRVCVIEFRIVTPVRVVNPNVFVEELFDIHRIVQNQIITAQFGAIELGRSLQRQILETGPRPPDVGSQNRRPQSPKPTPEKNGNPGFQSSDPGSRSST